MNNDDPHCTYKRNYKDPLTRKIKTYECDRKPVSHMGLCIFHDNAYFKANLHEATREFNKEIQDITTMPLIDAMGRPEAFFIGCNIPRSNGLKFRRDMIIRFNHAVFHERAMFANFDVQLADFSWAKFKGDLKFAKCKIDRLVFNSTQFGSTMSVNDCQIGDMSFVMNRMDSRLSVFDSVFKNNADFHGVKFSKGCSFVRTSFENDASFMHTKFHRSGEFHHVDFQNPSRVKFHCIPRDVSFLYTDITRIWFSPDMKWGDADRPMIYDEINMCKNKVGLSAVQSVYRDLRANYDLHMDYPLAGRFFVREMDLHRLYHQDGSDVKRKKFCDRMRSPHYDLYNAVSRYGEDLGRIIKFDICIFVATLAYFLAQTALDPGQHPGSGPLDVVNHALSRTLGGGPAGDGAHFMDHVMRGLGLLFVGMTFVSLRRKLERRFRH